MENTVEATVRPMLDEHTLQETRRILANCYTGVNPETVEKIEGIATSLNEASLNEDQIENFKSQVTELIDLANRNMRPSVEIDNIPIEISERTKALADFKTWLNNEGHMLGQLVGAELILFSNKNEQLLKEPLLLTGVDFVLSFLNEESQMDKKLEVPDELKDFHQRVISSTSEVVENLTSFRERLPSKQIN